MPKVTFYNLPEHKKATLISAVNQEFSRVPLYDASISNIVKSAGIPRSSFYQYFADKEDAFLFLLNEHAKQTISEEISSLWIGFLEDMYLYSKSFFFSIRTGLWSNGEERGGY